MSVYVGTALCRIAVMSDNPWELFDEYDKEFALVCAPHGVNIKRHRSEDGELVLIVSSHRVDYEPFYGGFFGPALEYPKATDDEVRIDAFLSALEENSSIPKEFRGLVWEEFSLRQFAFT